MLKVFNASNSYSELTSTSWQSSVLPEPCVWNAMIAEMQKADFGVVGYVY